MARMVEQVVTLLSTGRRVGLSRKEGSGRVAIL